MAEDRYEWTPCRVVGWAEAERAFVVTFRGAADGATKTKRVKRLNLRFMVGGLRLAK